MRCDRDDMAVWLREMMGPAVDFVADGPAGATVVMVSSDLDRLLTVTDRKRDEWHGKAAA